MKRISLFIFFVMSLMLVLFILAEVLQVPFLSEENFPTQEPSLLTASINTVLLIVDVVLPVPSSLVMLANGALFGVLLGTSLSFIGATISVLLGYWIGQSNRGWLKHFLSEQDLERARNFMQRWGVFAIILSRPVPILAETISIIAGTTGLTWQTAVLAAALGLLPITLLYAFVGASASSFDSGIWAFLLVIATASLTWVFGLWFKRNQEV